MGEYHKPGPRFEGEPQPDPFWNHDEEIGEGIFFGEPATIRLMAHISQERYQRRGELYEIVPLQAKSGTRIYVIAKPYILLPDYRLTIGLYSEPNDQGVIGEVTNSDWVGMRQQVIGHAQAWHYKEDHTLVLWECFLEDWFRQEDPSTDDTLLAYLAWI